MARHVSVYIRYLQMEFLESPFIIHDSLDKSFILEDDQDVGSLENDKQIH